MNGDLAVKIVVFVIGLFLAIAPKTLTRTDASKKYTIVVRIIGIVAALVMGTLAVLQIVR